MHQIYRYMMLLLYPVFHRVYHFMIWWWTKWTSFSVYRYLQWWNFLFEPHSLTFSIGGNIPNKPNRRVSIIVDNCVCTSSNPMSICTKNLFCLYQFTTQCNGTVTIQYFCNLSSCI